MRFPRNLRPFTGQLDVAPFAGVLLLLVLFLLLHTSIAPTPGVRIRLPAVEGVDASAPTPALVVTIDQQELWYFEHQAVQEHELKDRLAARIREGRRPPTLLIQADESVRQTAILRLAAIARAAGVREVVLGTRPVVFPPSPAAGKSRP